MEKVFHPAVAKVMQAALVAFRRSNPGITVNEMCSEGAAACKSSFYNV